MTKTEEIAFKYVKGEHPTQQMFSLLDVMSAMKEYAELYAKKCLEIAAEEATADFECVGAVLGTEHIVPYVEKSSILKINFPDHL